jgi:hypothetical protein
MISSFLFAIVAGCFACVSTEVIIGMWRSVITSQPKSYMHGACSAEAETRKLEEWMVICPLRILLSHSVGMATAYQRS